MQTERRNAPRQGLNSLIYLDLEPDNGGILLNLSEDGMQISVANRLVTASEVRFTLRLQPSDKICGTGRIAWLSPSGRSAGVHFLDLPESARREIRQWMGQAADSLSAEDAQSLLESPEETPQREAAAAAPIEAPEPRVEAATSSAPEAQEELAESPAAPPDVEALPAFSETREAEPAARETIAPTPETLSVKAEASQPPEPPLEAVAAEIAEAEVPSPTIEAPAPVPTDALELLESTVEAPTLEAVPPAWTPPATPPIEAPLSDGSGPEPSVLSLYGIDGREKEESDLPDPPPETWNEVNARPPIAATSARMRRRAEARRRATTAPRPSFRPRPEIEPDPVILDGLTDVSISSKPSAPAFREAPLRARPLKLTSPIFIPAPPQFDLPAPEITSFETYTPPAPASETSPAPEPLPNPWPEQSPSVSTTVSLTETQAMETTLGHGALYLPNYKVDGVTPDGTWRASRLFSSPLMAIREIFERFEAFGWSLESDWHVWLAMILLFAGFLALTEKPPLVVLTVAFWFASAVVMLSRQRPRHGARQAQKSVRR